VLKWEGGDFYLAWAIICSVATETLAQNFGNYNWNGPGSLFGNHSNYGGYGGYGRRGGYGMGGLSMSLNLTPLFNGVAAQNYQAAYQQYIQNQALREQTYFDMKRMNASYQAEQAMMYPPATPDELRDFSQARLPAPLSANEFDPGKGVIQWPGVLNRKEFDDSRSRLEGLFAAAAADPHGSGLGTQNCRDIQHVVDEMDEKLHSEIAEFKPNEYIAASKFLKSFALHASTPGGDTLAKQ
jgi:hypothetical protein